MLVEMRFGDYPMALGVIYDDPRPTFNDAVIEQNREASVGKTPNLANLLKTGQTWEVSADD
jgi:2-oxoglutarate ferredoxin oxidoreductase subunit beta